MHTLAYADEVILVDEPGIFVEPPYISGQGPYGGSVLPDCRDCGRDRSRAREELGLPRDGGTNGGRVRPSTSLAEYANQE